MRKNKLKNILAFSMLLALLSFAVQDFRQIKTVAVSGSFLTTDNLNNAYVITDANEFLKFNSSGEKQYAFSEKNYGKLIFADASNPLKILAFYPDYSVVIALDKTLTPIGKYNFRQAGIFRIGAVGLAYDNNVWIYDEQDFKLKKLDENLKVIRESDDLNLLLNISLKPNFLVERNNKIYLNNPQTGILVFDGYGTYFKTILVKNLSSFQVLGEKIFYFENNSLKSHQTETLQEQMISLPDSSVIIGGRVEKDLLFLLKKDELVFYQY